MNLKEDWPSEITRKNILLLVAAIALVSTGGFLGSNLDYSFLDSKSISEDQVTQNLVSILETQSGQDHEVVSIKTENGLYKVDVADQQSQLSTYYITKDGEMIADRMTEFKQLKETVDAQSNFANCLSERNVVMYGNISQQETSLQIQVLGGSNMVRPIYRDLNDQQVLQEAVQRDVQRTPSLYYNGSVLSGVNQPAQISEFTGCEYSIDQ